VVWRVLGEVRAGVGRDLLVCAVLLCARRAESDEGRLDRRERRRCKWLLLIQRRSLVSPLTDHRGLPPDGQGSRPRWRPTRQLPTSPTSLSIRPVAECNSDGLPFGRTNRRRRALALGSWSIRRHAAVRSRCAETAGRRWVPADWFGAVILEQVQPCRYIHDRRRGALGIIWEDTADTGDSQCSAGVLGSESRCVFLL
jgi:hypothetical protein